MNIKYDKQGGEFAENGVDCVSAEFGRNTGCTKMVHNISFSSSFAYISYMIYDISKNAPMTQAAMNVCFPLEESVRVSKKKRGKVIGCCMKPKSRS